MYEFLNRDSRGMRWAVFGLWASWIVTGLGCGGGGPTTGVDLTVESDDLLMLDTIDVAMRAIGKDEHHVNQPAARTVRVRIVTDGLGTGAVVNLDVTGVKNQKAAVVARAQAIVMRGSVVPITVRLTQACAGVLTCPATETCSGGRCIPIPQMGDTGMSGTGTGGAVGTGGAIGTGGIPGTGGTSTGTGGGVSATGGIGTSGSGGATGGASGSPATGGGPALAAVAQAEAPPAATAPADVAAALALRRVEQAPAAPRLAAAEPPWRPAAAETPAPAAQRAAAWGREEPIRVAQRRSAPHRT